MNTPLLDQTRRAREAWPKLSGRECAVEAMHKLFVEKPALLLRVDLRERVVDPPRQLRMKAISLGAQRSGYVLYAKSVLTGMPGKKMGTGGKAQMPALE